jgi:hypothetical protein
LFFRELNIGLELGGIGFEFIQFGIELRELFLYRGLFGV